jgi:hypothetical protein
MSDSEKNYSQQASGSNVYVITEQTRATDEDFFDATDAVRLFNRRIESALEKQRVAIVSEIHEKFQSKSSDSCALRAEGNRIQFSFNEERLKSLELIERKLMVDDVSEITSIIQREKEALRHRNKILCIADKHGWDTVKEYTDSDLADNAEDATKLRGAIFRAAKKRKCNYDGKDYQAAKPGIYDGLTSKQLFRGNSGSQHFNQKFNRQTPAYFRGNQQTPGKQRHLLVLSTTRAFREVLPIRSPTAKRTPYRRTRVYSHVKP